MAHIRRDVQRHAQGQRQCAAPARSDYQYQQQHHRTVEEAGGWMMRRINPIEKAHSCHRIQPTLAQTEP
jgi:hypothetical protein